MNQEQELLERVSDAGEIGLVLRTVAQKQGSASTGGKRELPQSEYEEMKTLAAEAKLQLFVVTRLGLLGEYDSIEQERVRLSDRGLLRLEALRDKEAIYARAK